MNYRLAEVAEGLSLAVEPLKRRHAAITEHLEKLSHGFAAPVLTVFECVDWEKIIVIREKFHNPYNDETDWYMAFSQPTRRLVMFRVKQKEEGYFARTMAAPYGTFGMAPLNTYYPLWNSNLIDVAHGTSADAFGEHFTQVLQRKKLWEPNVNDRQLGALFMQLEKFQNPFPSATKDQVLPSESNAYGDA